MPAGQSSDQRHGSPSPWPTLDQLQPASTKSNRIAVAFIVELRRAYYPHFTDSTSSGSNPRMNSSQCVSIAQVDPSPFAYRSFQSAFRGSK